jgi:hypothetical protein
MEKDKQQTLQALVEYYRQKSALVQERKSSLWAKFRERSEQEKLKQLRKEVAG